MTDDLSIADTMRTEDYRKHVLTVRTNMVGGTGNVPLQEKFRGFIDGIHVYTRYGASMSIEKVMRHLKHEIDVMIADSAIRAECERVVNSLPWLDFFLAPSVNADGAKPEVGSICWGHGFGRMRRGIVESVKRTGTVVMAFTTPSNPGQIYRATLKPGEAYDEPR